MNQAFTGNGLSLTPDGFDKAQSKLGVSAASLWSLLTVETLGFGFLVDRRAKILFERHIFRKRTDGQFDTSNPDISSHNAGGYAGGAAEYLRLAKAISLNRQAALESTSWGLGQIMGFNAIALGYSGVEDMVQRFMDGEDAQLDGTQRYITNNKFLAEAFVKGDWKKVAFFYNGTTYAINQYDVKLKRFFDLYKINGGPVIAIRSAQVKLAYLGFDSHGVDGVIGNGTSAAIVAFQAAHGIPQNGALDELTKSTLDQLMPS